VELELLGLISGSGSLFSNINLSEFIPKNGIGFVGQSGSWYRQELIKQFKKKPNFNYLESSGWGSSDAPVKPNYVKNIIENRVTLHLPGNVTNQTHRYMESLLLKRLPASPPFTFQDHHLTEYWTESTHLRNCLSYRRLVNSILEMRDDEYSEILERERLKLQNRIKTIRGQVETFLS
jgi:hypothetical protein